MADIKLGDLIEDVVAGVRGIAHGKVEYLDGSRYWIIQPTSTNYTEVPVEVHAQAAYCVKIGDGVYVKPKPPLGFNAEAQRNGS